MADVWIADWSLNQQLDTLVRWATLSAAPLAFHAIIAPAGAGKTALARQLIDRVRAERPGWHVDFLRDEPIPAVPMVLVADGAGSMVPLIRRAARAAYGAAIPLRIVLLERLGSRDRGWLYNLLGDSWIGDEFSQYAFEVPSTVSTPGGEAKRRIFEAALAAWSERLSLPVPAFDPKPFEMRPPHEDWHNPGYLWMAARESYRTSPAAALRLRERTLYARGSELSRDRAGAVVESKVGAMSREELETADGLLPHDEASQSARANAVATRLAELVRASDDPPAERARALRNLAQRFSDLDRPAEAAEAAAEAAAIYRDLGAGYEIHLAAALIRQGANVRALGQPSIEITREAVGAGNRTDDECMRARALSHHGDSLAAADRWKEAHDAYRGSIEILMPRFPSLPNRAMVLLSATFDDYKRACERIGRSPESSLTGALEEFFAR